MDPFELSALGTAGGALLAAIAYLAKTLHERRRVTRTVLYHLVELHHAVSRTELCLKSLEDVLITAVRQAMAARNETYIEQGGTAAMKAARSELIRFAMAQLGSLSMEWLKAIQKRFLISRAKTLC